MKTNRIQYTQVYSCLLFLLFVLWLAISILHGIVTLPTEGDSVNLHIPLAKSLFSSRMFHPNPQDILYPAAIESLLFVFIKLNLPLNLFNLCGVIGLFIGSFLLGRRLKFDSSMSVAFATSVVLLHGIVRWSQTQKPDIWMLVFFVLLLWGLLKEKKGLWDYLLLGIFSGFFVGAKFTAPVFFLITLFIFRKNFFSSITLYKGLIFFLPLFVIGCFWYIRNYFFIGSPVYLEGYSFISGKTITPLTDHAWRGYIFFPHLVLNAYISEYLIWGFGLIFIPIWLFYRKNVKGRSFIFRYFFIAIAVLFISFILPFWSTYSQIVGTMRYTFPMSFLIILCMYMIAKKEKKEVVLMQVSLVVCIISIYPDYHPKLIFVFVPLVILYYYRYSIFKLVRTKIRALNFL